MLELTGQPRPPGEVACHEPTDCNDGRCANPRHIRWDTVTANNRDQQIAGTAFAPTGERNGRAKLTNKQAAEIKRALALPAHCRPLHADLADRYRVSHQAISSISTGRTWSHLPTFVIPA